MVEPARPPMTIWRMRIACWIPKATDTHSEYVTLIDFPLQQWLHERSSTLHYTYEYTSCTLNYILATTISSTLETNFSRSSSKNRLYRTVLDGGNQDSSVALVTWLRAGRTRNCGSIPARSKIFFSARHPDRLQGPPSPLLNVCQIFLRGPKRQGREAGHLPPFSTEVKNVWGPHLSHHCVP
jgi:hypothetical protein